MPPFTTSQARQRGLSRQAIRSRLADGTLRRLFRGVYVDADEPDTPELRAAAIQLLRPRGDTVVYLRSAAWLHGLDVLPPHADRSDWPLELAVPSGRTPPRVLGCRGFQTPLLEPDITTILGIPVTTSVRTALDCGRLLPRLDGQAAVDQFVRRDPALLAQLRRDVSTWEGRRWCRRLQAVIEIADPRVESPGESWTRVVLVEGGLPPPEPQIDIADESGHIWARLDGGYPEFMVAIEYDGLEFHEKRSDRMHDNARRARLEELGWIIIVARREHIRRDRADLLISVWNALLERGYDPPEPPPDEYQLRRIAA